MIYLQSEYVTCADLFRRINASEQQRQIFEDLSVGTSDSVPDFMTLYNLCSSSWIFEFLRVLDSIAENNSQDLETIISMNDLYIRIEEWILEDPSFLAFFPEEKQLAIKYKAECMLFRAYARQEALQLIISSKDEQYVSDLLHKMEVSGGNLFDREKKLTVLLMILLHNPNILATLTAEFICLFQIISEQGRSVSESMTILDIIESWTKQQNIELDSLLLMGQITPEIKNRVKSIIRLTGARFLIAKRNNTKQDIIWRIMFYRYLCIIDERHPEALKNLAFNTLISTDNRPVEFTWEELTDFSLSHFADKISYFTVGSTLYDDSQSTFEGLGLITLADKIFTVTPYQDVYIVNQLSRFISCLDGAVNVRTKYKSKIDLNICPDLCVLSKHWEAVWEEYKKKPARLLYVVKKERPPVGTRLKIRVKNLTPLLPLLAFVRIEDDQYEGEGVLHAKEVTRIKLFTLEGIFCQGNLMTACVIESSDERLSFSILEDIGASIGARFHAGEYTHARLQAKKDNLLIWLSESGYPVYTGLSSLYDPEVGDVHILKLKDVNYNGYIKAKIEERVTDMEIDPNQVVAELISYYIDNSTDAGYDSFGENEEETVSEYDTSIPLDYIRQLVYILDLYTNSDMDYIHKFNLLNTIRLICRICEDAIMENFYICRINYMLELYRFTDRQTFDCKVINNEIVQTYPRLYKAQTLLSLLNISNNHARIEELQTYIASGQKQVSGLARLLLSRYLLDSVCPRLVCELNIEVLALLAFSLEETKQEDEINFGRENNNREFKSTIVFPPESHCSANVDKQMDNILVAICGFLNAEGGVLYVGVNDSGFPQGIAADLKYLQCNDDKYQLLIRKYIVKELGQAVNSLINIDFQCHNEKTVCCITVPVYHQIVSFKDRVWQRQGNSTRSLDNTALKFLKERRKIAKVSGQISTPELDGSYGISTSRLNVFDEERVTIAYFSIFVSGKYMISAENPYRNDARLTLPIYEDNRDGYLLQMYDNGYVNRVAVATILSKKMDYEYINALFDNAAIAFITIVNKNDFLYIRTGFKGEEYVKMLSLKWIKINVDLSLKGTALFAVPFERIVEVDVLSSKQAKVVENIKNELSTTLGCPVTAIAAVKDVLYLQNLLHPSDLE